MSVITSTMMILMMTMMSAIITRVTATGTIMVMNMMTTTALVDGRGADVYGDWDAS